MTVINSNFTHNGSFEIASACAVLCHTRAKKIGCSCWIGEEEVLCYVRHVKALGSWLTNGIGIGDAGRPTRRLYGVAFSDKSTKRKCRLLKANERKRNREKKTNF